MRREICENTKLSGAYLWYWNFLDHWVRLWNRNVLCDVLDDDLDRFAVGNVAP